MTLVTYAPVRKLCEQVLATLQSTDADYVNHNFPMELVDRMSDVIERRQTSTELQVSREQEELLSICYLGTLAVVSFAVLFNGPKLPRVLLSAWDGPKGSPDADFVVQGLLSSICAHSLAVLKLVRCGFEPPARIVLRNVHELTWIAITVCADLESMRLFAQDLSDEDERRLFRTHFSTRALNARLQAIESSIGLPDDVSSELRASRSSTYAFYSKTVHNSYPSVMLGMIGFSLERKGYAAIGMATEASHSTLRSLSIALFYFLGFFFEIIHRVHSFSPPYPQEWQEAFAARQLFIASFMSHESSHRDD